MVVIFDILNTIIREILRLMKDYEKKSKIALGLLFTQLLLMVLLITIISIIKYKYELDNWPITFLQSIGVYCYFIGDNFYYVMNRYGGCLQICDILCIKICYYIAVALSGVAASVYAVVKVLQLAWKENSGRSKEKEEWIDFLPMIAVIAEMDLLYTIASSKLTGTGEAAASCILLGIAIIIGISLIIGKTNKLWKKINKWNYPIQTVPIDTWIEKLSENPVEDIGEWNINDTWRSLHDQLSDNKFILMKRAVDNNNDANIEEIQAAHINNVNTIRRNLATIQNNLATAQGTLNIANPEVAPTHANLNNLRDSLNTLRETLENRALQDFQFLMINNRYKCLSHVMTILIIIPLGFHTLGDNLEPLDTIHHSIKCTQTDFTNTTVNCQNEESCEFNSIIRLALAGVSLISILIPSLYCFINWFKSLYRPRTLEEMNSYERQHKNLRLWQSICCWRCYSKGQPVEGHPVEGHPVEGHPVEGHPVEGQSDDGQSDDEQSDEGQSDEGQSDEGLSDEGLSDEGLSDEGLAEERHELQREQERQRKQRRQREQRQRQQRQPTGEESPGMENPIWEDDDEEREPLIKD